MCKILVIGLGNVMLGDDGLGVHFIRMLECEKLPENVTLLDVGTSIFKFIDEILNYDYVIFVDAIDLRGKPGQPYLLKVELEGKGELEDLPITNPHSVGLNEALEVLRAYKGNVRGIYVIGCQPSRVDLSLELSREVRECLKLLKLKLLELLKEINRNC